MTRSSRCLTLGLVAIFAASVARAEDVRAAIEAGNRAFVSAFLAGDAKAIARLYTADAEVIAPGAPVARGRDAIAAAWQKSIDSGIEDVRLKTLDVASAGDLASETGVVELVSRDGTTTSARYVVVWKRESGQWRLHRDIWNSEK